MTSSSLEAVPHAAGDEERERPRAAQVVQYVFLQPDPAWRRLPAAQREEGRREFAEVLQSAAPAIETFAYSTLGLKTSAELLLWWQCEDLEPLQETLGQLLLTGLGRYCTVSNLLWGLTRPSIYAKRRGVQEQAFDEPNRLRYLVVYPFTKTSEWYLLSQDARQGLMNQHMRIGREYTDIRQVLLYSTGLDDQEFVVAYETDSIARHQQLVIDLRSTEARRYTLRDTPIFTAIHRPLDGALALLG